MRFPIATKDSVTDHPGGYFTSGSGTTTIDGSPLLLDRDTYCCPLCPNRPEPPPKPFDPDNPNPPEDPPIPVYCAINATGRAKHHGKSLARLGDLTDCGAKIISGHDKVMVS